MSTLALFIITLATAADFKCPEGTQFAGAAPPGGTERSCVKTLARGERIKHGPYAEWYTTGQILKEGSFYNGKRAGVWLWYWPNGKKRQQGYYENDKPLGKWLYWNENGRKLGKLDDKGNEVGPADETGDVQRFHRGLKDAFK